MKLKQDFSEYDIIEVIRSEDIEALDWLIKNIVDLSSVDGVHAAQFAAYTGKLKVLEFISNNTRVDLTLLSNTGKNLAHFAAKGESLDTLIYLHNNGININLSDNNGFTPLHIASLSGFIEGVKYLVESGADVNSFDVKGVTPLHSTAQRGHDSVIVYLVKGGAKLNFQDNCGATALYHAAHLGITSSVECLINLGSNVSVCDLELRTPLHVAAKQGFLEIVKCLINNGADLEAEDTDKRSPLDLAFEHEESAIVRFLIEQGALCNYELSGDCERPEDYFMVFGDFLQDLCLARTSKDYSSEILSSAIKQKIFVEKDLVEFATLTVKNFALKVGASGKCIIKIKNCSELPEFIKLPLLELMEPLITDAQQSLECFDSELMYLNQILPEPISYSTVRESNESGINYIENLNIFTTFYDGNPRFKKAGEFTFECIYNLITKDLSPLCGFMYTANNVKEGVESLLKSCIPVKLRQLLTKVMKDYNNFIQNEGEFVFLLEQIKWSPAHNEIPDAMARAKNQAMESLELNLMGESQVADGVVEYS